MKLSLRHVDAIRHWKVILRGDTVMFRSLFMLFTHHQVEPRPIAKQEK